MASAFQKHVEKAFPPRVRKRVDEKWWGVFNRPISLRISYLLKKTAVTPNMVTVANLFISTFGGFALLLPEPLGLILFLLSYELWGILDCIDGELARSKDMKSFSGPYLDLLGHYTTYLGIFIPLGIKLEWMFGGIFDYAGFLIAILAVFAALAQHLRLVVLYKENVNLGKPIAKETDSVFLAIYRFLVGPLEIAIIAFALLMLYLYIELPVIIWSVLLGGYFLLFLFSGFMQIISAKKELDDAKKS